MISLHCNYAEVAQFGRASASQAEGRGFESRFPLEDKNIILSI